MTCRKADIKNFRIHDIRHTCTAWLVTAGVPLAEVRDLLGHKTVQMTERYAHLSPENILAAVARLDESDIVSHRVFRRKDKPLILKRAREDSNL